MRFHSGSYGLWWDHSVKPFLKKRLCAPPLRLWGYRCVWDSPHEVRVCGETGENLPVELQVPSQRTHVTTHTHTHVHTCHSSPELQWIFNFTAKRPLNEGELIRPASDIWGFVFMRDYSIDSLLESSVKSKLCENLRWHVVWEISS